MNFDKLKDIFDFQQKPDDFHPVFHVGDTVKIHFFLKDTKKGRTQLFEGVVLSIKGFLNNKSFCVRKSSGEFNVEKHFFYNSPLLTKIEILRHGKVRRSKIYYLRNLRGKAARIKEQRRLK